MEVEPVQGHLGPRPHGVEYLEMRDAVVDLRDLAVVGLEDPVEPVEQVPLRHGGELVAADGRHHVRGLVVVHPRAPKTGAWVPVFEIKRLSCRVTAESSEKKPNR